MLSLIIQSDTHCTHAAPTIREVIQLSVLNADRAVLHRCKNSYMHLQKPCRRKFCPPKHSYVNRKWELQHLEFIPVCFKDTFLHSVITGGR